jgi:hypothetical protein
MQSCQRKEVDVKEQTIDRQVFEAIFKNRIEKSQLERALKVFQTLGNTFSWKLTEVLLCAQCQGRIEQILSALEQHIECADVSKPALTRDLLSRLQKNLHPST